ncbi:hypothetical protein CEUSTIGMA_g12130.t1 [Chlamydomonas eustigma]|uniref:MJ1316 RNA cyclic group end recognition domain-containing protein n=1 Tax=Chlamydomonas eustigma TaxID=1157962 RepID=A0A250XNR1_9CHLO|nr:hypothetical protein CEUSTIGMA_g12130.t1 [Chlamydomonas eustigma]|eukprot:GAX84708.1 hypothetical protein CEUSTIGMA_g12130.t1 [Chlamydomonas eustigma]
MTALPAGLPRPGNGYTTSLNSSPLPFDSFESGPASSSKTCHGTSPVISILGSSPTSRSSHDKTPHEAKKFWKRLCFDTSLDPRDFVVGFVESVEQQVRQSGAGAWSMRVHDLLREVSHAEFTGMFKSNEIPFHRIAYFKHKQAVVWESEYYKRTTADNDAVAGPVTTPSSIKSIDASGSAPRGGFLGSSPPTARFSSFTIRQSRGLHSQGGGSFSLVGGSSDEEEDGEDRTTVDAGWQDDDEEDMMAGPMEGDGLPDAAWQRTSGGQAPADVSRDQEAELQLPEECWLEVLKAGGVREMCNMARVNRWLRELTTRPELWRLHHHKIFGEEPASNQNAATVRRLCRRSEIKAARWIEAEVQEHLVGRHPDTVCLQLDDAKAVTADGQEVRVWSHATGRRIATLKGHAGTVTSIAFNDQMVVSGCNQGAVRIWGMDDLKCTRTLRNAHEGGVGGVAILNGFPVTAGADGCVKLWDATASLPVLDLHTPRLQRVNGLEVHKQSGYIISCGDGVHIFDAESAELLHDLRVPLEGDSLEPDLDDQENHFTCLSYSGSVIAAGLQDCVVLWDPRCASPIGSIKAPKLTGMLSSNQGNGPASGGCVSIQLDDWKLVAGFNQIGQSFPLSNVSPASPALPTGGIVAVYDIRAVGSMHAAAPAGRAGASSGHPDWLQPLQVFRAPGKIHCVKFFEGHMMAGLAGMDCWMWSFKPPRSSRVMRSAHYETEGSSPNPHSHKGSTGYGSAVMGSLASAAAASWQQGDMMSGSVGASPLAQQAEDGRRVRTVRPAKAVVKRANNNRFPKRR